MSVKGTFTPKLQTYRKERTTGVNIKAYPNTRTAEEENL